MSVLCGISSHTEETNENESGPREESVPSHPLSPGRDNKVGVAVCALVLRLVVVLASVLC